MAAAVNHQVRLAARPVGLPTDTDWELTTEPIPKPGDGEFVVANAFLSIDPAMRGWMNEARSYVAPVQLGAVMRAGAVGEVTASRHSDFDVGDYVYGAFGVQEYARSDGLGVFRVDRSLAPLPTYLGALGVPGLTAYFGLLDVGRLVGGETVLISGAAGAVGSVAGQIARIMGCTVIGVAGGPEKCAWIVEELGFEAAIDYKHEDVRRALRDHPRIDVYFDNVGGDVLDAALSRLDRGGRIVLCGGISQYNATRARGPANYLALIPSRGSMTGMVVFDYADRYPEAMEQLARWLVEGRLVAREQVVGGGVSAFPQTLLKLFAGENTGKLVLEV